ncbi:hypothetical protein [Bradyrhizobium guangdongense]|uniref:hypothetical protein n=1 Tax=Bradyrhizobium guangdongense TaxID=1325090 RepID=UPI001319BEBF|nr:hypothetical protein [Bradyrhizobium guangdongense]
MIKIIAIILLAPLLAGCASRGPASIAGGECKIFEAPKYEVRGKAAYDQDWIDSTVEGGVGGCRWKRPQPRPAGLNENGLIDVTKPPTAKRKSLVRRIRDRVMPAKEWPAVAPPIAPAPAVMPPPAPPPRPPRSAIERLLEPRDDD